MRHNVNLLLHDILLYQSPDEGFINTMKDTLESAGCICRITNSF